ncbi:MAG: hypothetical protein J0L84_06715 [Verrucomicrobia bacterium]|nr:hypothetical protein [Verrucomicrobiota bacterium]
MKRVHYRRALSGLHLFAALILASPPDPLAAQPAPRPLPDFWHPDGPVYALSSLGETLYLGGNFTYVGPINGSVGAANASDGTVTFQLPELEGDVLAIARSAAGDLYLGGNFTLSRGGYTNLVRILPNGQLDPWFRPYPTGPVRALALGSGHTLYVGGDFQRISGTTRRFLTGLDATSGAANAWAPACQAAVHVLTVSGDTVFVGGKFTSLGGQSRSRLGSLDATTGAVTPWNPGASGGTAEVRALLVDGDLVYVGGVFTICGGKPRNRIAAVDAAGMATAWDPNAGGASGVAVNALASSGDTVLVGGSFSSIGGANRANLAGIDPASGLALTEFSADTDGAVTALAAGDDGLLVGGAFRTVGGVPRRGLARLAAATAPGVTALARTGGQVDFAGRFASFGGVLRDRLAALDGATGRANGWNPGADRDVLALAASADTIYAGGLFTTVGGEPRNRLAAVHANGQILPFNPGVTATAANGVLALSHAQNQLVVGGGFTAVGTSNRNGLALLNLPAGSVAAWDPNARGGAVRTVLPHGGLVYVGGDFTSVAGTNRRFLAAIGAVTATNARAFNAGPSARVQSLQLVDDALYVGGEFTSIGGLSRNRLALLDAATGLASPSWNPGIGLSGQLRVTALLVSGEVLNLGGTFTSAGGEFRTNAGSLFRSTGTATAWNPAPNGIVRALLRMPGKLIVAGEFTTAAGRSAPFLAAYDTGARILTGSPGITPSGDYTFQASTGDGTATSLEVQASSRLTNHVWETLETYPATGAPVSFSDPPGRPADARYYRTVLE